MLENKLIILQPSPQSEGLANLIDNIVALFDNFSPDPSSCESYELSEEKLKRVIQKIFMEMKDKYS